MGTGTRPPTSSIPGGRDPTIVPPTPRTIEPPPKMAPIRIVDEDDVGIGTVVENPEFPVNVLSRQSVQVRCV